MNHFYRMTEKIIKYKNKTPIIKKNVFIADGSKVIGNVEINEDSSIWFNCVLRGDVDYIKIGKNTNIQDGTIIHVSSYGFSATGRNGSPTEIGNNVTIGHNATIHACKIDDNALIGMGSVVLDNAIINHMAFIAAGAVITPGSVVKENELWAGNPAKFLRMTNETEKKLLINTPKIYGELRKEFLKMKFFNILFLIPFLLLASCETITDWTEAIIPGDDEVIDSENNQELVSDEQEMRDPTLEEILAESEENDEGFVLAEEQLSATPAKEYDSVLIDENQETTIPESTQTQPTEIIQEDSTEITDNIFNEQAEISQKKEFKIPESLQSSLNLKEKIQYRVATITFRSGSSSVDGDGQKKIKKIVKIAKERDAKIKVIGHASERTKDMPIAEHKIVNFIISDKRAHSVANIFIEKYGFPRNKLITEAVSDSKPLFKEIMPAGTKANQRTEIFLIY